MADNQMHDHAYTSYKVYNILICRHCTRMQVLEGNGSWYNVGEPYEGMSTIVTPVITSCWRCGLDNTMSSIPFYTGIVQFATNLELVSNYIGRPTLLTSIMNEQYRELRTEQAVSSEDYTNVKFIVTNIYEIMSGMYCEYRLYSLTSTGNSDPHDDFIEEGKSNTIVQQVFNTPFTANTILFCATCKRNVVFSGFVTFYPLGRVAYIDTIESNQPEFNSLVFVECKRCHDTEHISRNEIIIHLTLEMLGNNSNISRIQQCFSTKVNIPMFNSSSSTNIQVLHRDKIVSALKYHCQQWTVNTNTPDVPRDNVVRNFI